MWSGKHEATGARLHEQWEIRVDNQCFSTRFSTQQISKRLPFPTDWTTVTQSLGQAIMEAKKPERQKHNEKKHIFHTTILEWRGNWVTASNQLLALPFSLRCDSEFYLTLCTSDLQWVWLMVCFLSSVWGNWLYRETDDQHSLRLNYVTSITAFTPVL